MNLRKFSRFTILFGKDGSCGMSAIDTRWLESCRSAIHPEAAGDSAPPGLPRETIV